MGLYSDKYRAEVVKEILQSNNLAEMSKKKRICKKTLQRWLERYMKEGQVVDKTRKGRPTQLTKDHNRFIRDSLNTGKKSCKDIKKLMEAKGVKVHKSTIARHAKLGKAGLEYSKVIEKPLLKKE